ncbi:5408_t:CDS:2, partial [Gigaspora margarita]
MYQDLTTSLRDITEVSLYGGRTADHCKEVSLLITPSFQRMHYVATQLFNNRPKSTLEHRLRHRVKCRNTTELSPQIRSGRYVVAMGRAIAKNVKVPALPRNHSMMFALDTPVVTWWQWGGPLQR